MILSNQRKCNVCGDEIYSAHRHDYQKCVCGETMVDGGQQYLRWGGMGSHSMNIVITQEEYDLLVEAIEDPTRNTLGKICNMSRVLRDKMGCNLTDFSKETEDE